MEVVILVGMIAACGDSTSAGDAPDPVQVNTYDYTALVPAVNANVDAFERLLAHDRGAVVVWQHVGAHPLGNTTPALVRRLLEDHPNLFVAVQGAGPVMPGALLPGGRLDPEWALLLEGHRERFVLGADDFFATPQLTDQPPRSTTFDLTWSIPDLLDPATALAVACDNPRRIYGLQR